MSVSLFPTGQRAPEQRGSGGRDGGHAWAWHHGLPLGKAYLAAATTESSQEPWGGQPATPLLGLHCKNPETLIKTDVWGPVFIAALFTIEEIWKFLSNTLNYKNGSLNDVLTSSLHTTCTLTS